MTVYSFNLGIGWANSGVEYAEAYRAKLLRNLKIPAKFIFTDLVLNENIEHLTANLGLKDEEIIWMYSYFTDIKIAKTTYTLEKLKDSLAAKIVDERRDGAVIHLYFEGENNWVAAYMKDPTSSYVERAEFVSNNCLYRKDYYSYTRVLTEYYTPRDNRAYLYQRRFFNEDGTTAYEELLDGDSESLFRFPDKVIYSKAELVAYFIAQLKMKTGDIALLDRASGIAQQLFENKGQAKLGVMIHADHFSENSTDDNYILWNNYYDYQFNNSEVVDFYVVATQAQNDLLTNHFKKYLHQQPQIYTIPVGSIEKLNKPTTPRRKFALMTASRLSAEKHVDWLVEAVVQAHENLPKLTLDIYGEGESLGQIRESIEKQRAGAYIHLLGHQDIQDKYINYSAYVTASTTEGFGLSLLEALGSGLPLVGLNVRYGMQTFVDNGQNGFVCPWSEAVSSPEVIKNLAAEICKLFEQDIQKFESNSYTKAKNFLEEKVQASWKELILAQGGQN